MVREGGYLYHYFEFAHSYPHCWRCKKPVIFRATEQWFVAVDHDDLRAKTLKVINEEVRWHPAWGRSRIEAMVSLRPDWCISRQRAWGVPIPALGCESCGTQLLTAETVRHFRDLFRVEGADAWFSKPVEEIQPPGATCPKCGGTAFHKEGDILDVWFESGSSHRAVLKEPSYGLDYPGVPLSGGLGPASRVVPVVDPDRRRDHRPGSVRGSPDARFHRRRARQEDGQVGRQCRLGRQGDRAIRRRCPPALRRQPRLRRRRPDERAGNQGDVRGLPEDPQHLPLPPGQPGGLRPVRPLDRMPRRRSTRSTSGRWASSTP